MHLEATGGFKTQLCFVFVFKDCINCSENNGKEDESGGRETRQETLAVGPVTVTMA